MSSPATRLEQARQVWLAGCGLRPDDKGRPVLWSGRESWQLLGTGFGSGLNFLATWQAWRDDPQRPDRLFFTSVLSSPLSANDILRSIDPLPELRDLAAQLARQWRAMLPGVHRLVFEGGRVQLTLLTGPAQELLPTLDSAVDSVFLEDCPARAGELPLLKAVARLCRPGTRLAAANSMRQLRDDLATAGFELDPPPAASPPRPEGLCASYAPRWQPKTSTRSALLPKPGQRRAVVVGSGLSGSACAWSLAQRGWQVLLLDAADHPAAGASALPAGMVAPHVSPDDAALSRLTRSGVRLTLQRASDLLQAGVDWAPSGVLEHRVEGKHSLPRTELWRDIGIESSRDADADDLAGAGLAPDSRALWHGLGGWLRPQQLVRAQLDHPAISWRGGCRVTALEALPEGGWRLLDANGSELARAEQVVLATAYASRELLQASGLVAPPLNPLRGQISWGAIEDLPPATRALLPSVPVNGHGCFISGTPGPDGRPAWIAGSTFERAVSEALLKPEDQLANRDKLMRLLPALGQALAPAFDQAGAWAGLRCTLPDRVPAVGPLDPQAWPGLHLCAGMGARGLTLSVLCGELLAALLHGEPWPVERRLAQSLLAARFVKSASDQSS